MSCKKFRRFVHSYWKWIWVLIPVIVIGGLCCPYIGLAVLLMILMMVLISFKKGRFWCGNLCPRGSFLDITIKEISRNKIPPKMLSSTMLRLMVLIVFLVLVATRVVAIYQNTDGWDLIPKLGSFFAGLFLFTTTIAIIIGIIYTRRSWCRCCPLGTLQDFVHKIKKGLKSLL